MNKRSTFITTLGFLVSFSTANPVTAGVTSAQENSLSNAVTISMQNVAQAQNQDTVVTIASLEAAVISVSGDDLQGCQAGSNASCQAVFKAVIRHIQKILTSEYRMAHSLHLFNANKVNYSLQTAQRITNALLIARK
jgi:hypothetical protein